jgi:hypothetical protein
LKEELEVAGVKVWYCLCFSLWYNNLSFRWDRTNMEGSPTYQMEEGVKRADFVLVLGSARYRERAEDPNSGVACEVTRTFIILHLFFFLLY